MFVIKKKSNINDENNNIECKRKSKNDIKIVQEILDIKEFEENTINKKYYIRINPKNISILTNAVLLGIIDNFKKVLNMGSRVELLVVDKTERLEDNKEYLKDLRDRKENRIERELLSQDIEELDRTFSKSSSREFYLIFPYRDNKEEEIIKQLERTIETQGFEVLRTQRYDLKNMLQVYFERNFSNQVVKDFDI